VTPEEFYWQDARYDHDSEQGRELLFLIANHEWVRATSEIVDIARSDAIETTIKTDIDLSQIRHEAFRGKSGRVWLPITVLPPQTVQRQLEPDLFATVTDAAGNLLPLLPADDLGHQTSAALAEIIVNMAVAHWPGLAGEQAGADGEESRSQVSRLVTRDQRVLLSAGIYRILRHGPASTGRPRLDPASAERAVADVSAALRSHLAGQDGDSQGSGLAPATFRIRESRRLEITGSPADSPQAGQRVNRTVLWGGDLDVSGIAAVRDEPADARTWRMIAIHADARSNIESDIFQCLPAEYQDYQLAHLNYAVLHGTAVIIILIHKAADGGEAEPSAGQVARPDEEAEPSWGQPHMVLDKNVSIRQLGPLTQHPLLRIHFRWQDQPGAFLNVVNAVSDFLAEESSLILPKDWSISYARIQVATGRVALGHLTIRLHDAAQDRKRWNSAKTEQMAREVSTRAGLYATRPRHSGGRENYPGSGQNPVIRVDFISKDPPRHARPATTR
jgi:hypothetical protein